MIQKNNIAEYFKKFGVEVSYYTLNATELLIKSYVQEFTPLISQSTTNESHYIKGKCYNQLYDIKPRHKFTGFENFKELDHRIREKIKFFINEPQYSSYYILENEEIQGNLGSYKTNLLKHVKQYNNCLLYLSGGIDSELVGLSMLDAGVKFTPVIFSFTNHKEECLNIEELSYAYEFCKTHGLFPIVKTLNIEKLWQSLEFEKFAIDLQISSPQIATHAYMIEIMKDTYRDKVHVFGGEVRFRNNYMKDDGRDAKLVQLIKVDPPTYNGLTYTTTAASAGIYAQTQLQYTDNDGSWVIFNDSGDAYTASGSPTSGTWTTTPTTLYEFRISTFTINTAGSGSNIPSTSPTSWASITAANTVICSVTKSTTTGTRQVTFTIELRKVGDTTPVVTSTIVLKGVLTV